MVTFFIGGTVSMLALGSLPLFLLIAMLLATKTLLLDRKLLFKTEE